MLFKFHEAQRHRIPKARYRVQNWAEYDRGLVRRGDISVGCLMMLSMVVISGQSNQRRSALVL